MEFRNLGRSSLKIAPLVFGGNVFGWTIDEATSHTLLDAFVDAGFNCVDTADVYTKFIPGNVGGESERVIGSWFAKSGKRDKVVLATKLGMEMGEGLKGLGAAYMVKAVEASLQRLKTDYIDLYQAHRDDPTTPLDETLEAFDRLVKAGKVRAIGASNYEAPRLKEALAISDSKGLARFQTLQPEYNLVQRGAFEGELEDACLANGVGVIPYWSLASGFLTGKYRTEADVTKSPRGKFATKYLNSNGPAVLAALDAVSARHGATLAQVALAWLMARPAITAPIASATSLAQLNDIMGAARLKLSAEDIAELDTASAP